jgi:hypothetical protein
MKNEQWMLVLRVALPLLGLALVIASCFALRDVLADGGLGARASETMLGSAAVSTASTTSALSALLLPLAAVLSFIAFAWAHHKKGTSALRSRG